MSLEQAVQSLEATIKTLITVMQSGATIAPPVADTPAAPAPAAPKPKTRYFNVESQKVAVSVKPGEAPPESGVEVDKAQFETLVKQYAEKPTEGVTFKSVVERITVLSKTEGRGRESVKALLTHFLPGKEGVKVPDLEPLKKNKEILDAVESLIATGKLPGAAESSTEDDDLGL